jgi:hypothetical protein
LQVGDRIMVEVFSKEGGINKTEFIVPVKENEEDSK